MTKKEFIDKWVIGDPLDSELEKDLDSLLDYVAEEQRKDCIYYLSNTEFYKAGSRISKEANVFKKRINQMKKQNDTSSIFISGFIIAIIMILLFLLFSCGEEPTNSDKPEPVLYGNECPSQTGVC